MGFGRLTKQIVTFVVVVLVAEAAWLASLAYLLDRFGVMALGAMLVLAGGGMVAVLDAAPLSREPTDRLKLR